MRPRGPKNPYVRFQQLDKPPVTLHETTLWDYPSQHYGDGMQGSFLGPEFADEEIARLYEATRATLTEWIERLRQERGKNFPEKDLLRK